MAAMAPHIRPISEIERDIAVHAEALAKLQAERRAAAEAKVVSITREFDAGRSLPDIADDRDMSVNAVRGVLYRSGRTETGRTAIALRIREAVQQGASA